MDLNSWRLRMSTAVATLNEWDLGYPLGDNHLLPPASSKSLASLASNARLAPDSPLLEFYHHCGGVSLPDIWNGYFVHEPELVMRILSKGGPRRINGPRARLVLPFGSDGGGGTFLLSTSGPEEVLFVREAALEDRTMDGTTSEVIAGNLAGFLERLLQDTEAFVEIECQG